MASLRISLRTAFIVLILLLSLVFGLLATSMDLLWEESREGASRRELALQLAAQMQRLETHLITARYVSQKALANADPAQLQELDKALQNCHAALDSIRASTPDRNHLRLMDVLDSSLRVFRRSVRERHALEVRHQELRRELRGDFLLLLELTHREDLGEARSQVLALADGIRQRLDADTLATPDDLIQEIDALRDAMPARQRAFAQLEPLPGRLRAVAFTHRAILRAEQALNDCSAQLRYLFDAAIRDVLETVQAQNAAAALLHQGIEDALGLGLLCCGLLLLVSFRILQGGVISPLARLSRAMGAFRDYGERVPLPRRTGPIQEIDSLSTQFDELASAVSQRARALTQANQELALMGEVFQNTLDAICITNAQGVIIKVNPAFTRITGFSSQEVLGQTPRLLRAARHDRSFYRTMRLQLDATGEWAGECWNRHKDGHDHPHLLSVSRLRGPDGEVAGYIAVFRDISEIKRQEERIRDQALHDTLTGLANRSLLLEQLASAMASAQREESRLALLFLDLDHFKNVNDSLGHATGDLLLREISQRLEHVVRKGDLICRFGGDEFVVLLHQVEQLEHALHCAQRISESIQQPVRIGEHSLFVGVSIGVASYPEDAQDPGSLLKCADMAMYEAKTQGRNAIRVFNNIMHDRAMKRLSLEEDIRKALETNAFHVAYQPRLNLEAGEVRSWEALARWNHPQRGPISPADFIPLCEETGLVIELGAQILRQACAFFATVRDKARQDQMTLAVNISARQLQHAGFVNDVRRILTETAFPPQALELEITETVIVSDYDKALKTLLALTDMGIQISVDDFGTGYSSLSKLKYLPIHTLKIDRGFIKDIPHDLNDASIVETILNMAENLGLQCVAEGVERAEHVTFLRERGCQEAQGFFFSKPLPEEDVLPYLLARSWRESLARTARRQTPLTLRAVRPRARLDPSAEAAG